MFFTYKKIARPRTEMRTRNRMYPQTIRTVRDISRDDRARIETCSFLTQTDRFKENYSIDAGHETLQLIPVVRYVTQGRYSASCN